MRKERLSPLNILIIQIFAFSLRMRVEAVVLIGLVVHFRDIAVTVAVSIGIAFKHDITSADSIPGGVKIIREGRPLDKSILVQYCDIKEEIKDLRKRIRKLDDFLSKPHQVSDTVKGTRRDGTIGSIKVTGYPVPEHYRKVALRERYRRLLEAKEAELLELTCQAEEYIESIPKAEMRIMMRLFCIDGLSYVAIARSMNATYPRRKVKYTDENVKKRIQRFFEKLKNVPQCPD